MSLALFVAIEAAVADKSGVKIPVSWDCRILFSGGFETNPVMLVSHSIKIIVIDSQR
jgi:hypothetical protein